MQFTAHLAGEQPVVINADTVVADGTDLKFMRGRLTVATIPATSIRILLRGENPNVG
jgi:hypothetical protein